MPERFFPPGAPRPLSVASDHFPHQVGWPCYACIYGAQPRIEIDGNVVYDLYICIDVPLNAMPFPYNGQTRHILMRAEVLTTWAVREADAWMVPSSWVPYIPP